MALSQAQHTLWGNIDKYQVSSIKYQVSCIKYQVSSIKYQVSSIKYQVSSIRARLVLGWGTAREDLRVLSAYASLEAPLRTTHPDQRHDSQRYPFKMDECISHHGCDYHSVHFITHQSFAFY